MKLITPEIQNPISNTKLQVKIDQITLLYTELNKRELTDEVYETINSIGKSLEAPETNVNKMIRKINQAQLKICQLVEKKFKIVPIKYYQTLWTSLGLSVFGVACGVVFGVIVNNMAFLAVGLPIGMVIGSIYGKGKDKKAFDEGRQLNIEWK